MTVKGFYREASKEFKRRWALYLFVIFLPVIIMNYVLVNLYQWFGEQILLIHGIPYLSHSTAMMFIQHPTSILLLILLLALVVLTVFFEFSFAVLGIRMIRNDEYHLGKLIVSTWKVTIHRGLRSIPGLFLFFLILLPGAEYFPYAEFFAKADIPDFILSFVASNIFMLIPLLAVYVVLIILGIRWIYTIPIMILKGKKYREALKISSRMTKGKRGRIFVLVLLFLALPSAISYVIQYALYQVQTLLDGGNQGTALITAIIFMVLILLINEAFMIYTTIFSLFLITPSEEQLCAVDEMASAEANGKEAAVNAAAANAETDKVANDDDAATAAEQVSAAAEASAQDAGEQVSVAMDSSAQGAGEQLITAAEASAQDAGEQMSAAMDSSAQTCGEKAAAGKSASDPLEKKKRPGKVEAVLVCIFFAVQIASFIVASNFYMKLPFNADEVRVISHKGLDTDKGNGVQNAISTMLKTHETSDPDFVEIDIHETKDNKYIVFHDESLKSLCGVDGIPHDYTLAELMEMKTTEGGESENLADFDEYLKAANEVGQPLLIEIKATPADSPDMLNRFIRQYGDDILINGHTMQAMDYQVITDLVGGFGSDKSQPIEAVQEYKAYLDAALAELSEEELAQIADFVQDNIFFTSAIVPYNLIYAGTGGSAVTMEQTFTDFRLIENAHKLGQEVYVWTINTQEQMESMILLGADGIITDRPALAHQVLDEFRNNTPYAVRLRLLMDNVLTLR